MAEFTSRGALAHAVYLAVKNRDIAADFIKLARVYWSLFTDCDVEARGALGPASKAN